ncbi:MAG: ectB [Microbacteriaceae bacterium]|nr:ectB [Microbacteriaceae bacterium]
MDLSIFNSMESEVRGYIRSFPVIFDHAHGSIMVDQDGVERIDFFSGAGTLNYGHNNPKFKQAIIDYIQADGIVHGLDMATTAKKKFLETFRSHVLLPRKLDYKLQFTGPTGANAVEAALKIARQVTGRTNVVAFTHGYHGLSLGALAATGNSKYRAAAGVPLGDVTFLPYDGYYDDETDTIAQFAKLLTDPSSGLDLPAAVIVETVQGEGGVNVARAEWLRSLADLCIAHGILLIADDIQIGCGRSGEFFSFEDSGIVPDVVILSKSLSGYGLPMSLVLIKPEYDIWKPGGHTGTFRGNNLAFVGATVALETYWADDTLSAEVHRKSALVRERLEKISADHPGEFSVRGRGLLLGLVGTDPTVANEIAGESFRNGLIIETSGAFDEVLKLLPALTIDNEVLERGLDIIEASANTVLSSRSAQAVAAK